MNKHYITTVICINCSHMSRWVVPFGTERSAFLEDKVCPNCGCKMKNEVN